MGRIVSDAQRAEIAFISLGFCFVHSDLLEALRLLCKALNVLGSPCIIPTCQL